MTDQEEKKLHLTPQGWIEVMPAEGKTNDQPSGCAITCLVSQCTSPKTGKTRRTHKVLYRASDEKMVRQLLAQFGLHDPSLASQGGDD